MTPVGSAESSSSRPVGPIDPRSGPSDEEYAEGRLESCGRDPEALLAVFEQDRTLVRFEALRAYLRLEDPRTTARLVALLEKESDEAAQELLGEALAAGGGAADAGSLARLIEDPSPSRRLAAASAILEIAEREPLPPGLSASAAATVEALAEADARDQAR